uniref:Gag-Pol polyprotein n=1 Tax=Tanacetum cinerariifolium TaxID=118510 RepID=A0A6L2JGF2_TANCI|nr:hypothetical protein [Tanacetum cinerariifolium]
MTLALLAKAFKVNTIPTNDNQRSLLIPRNSQIAQPGMKMSQDIKMQMVDNNVGNQIAQEEEAWIQSTQEEFEFMVGANAYEETETIKVNCTLEDTLQLASTSETQSVNALVYDTDGSTEEKEYATLWNNWYKKCEECKYDKISYYKAYNDMQTKIERLQAQLGDLKGKSNDTQCASNTLDLLSQKLEDKNVSLEF